MKNSFFFLENEVTKLHRELGTLKKKNKELTNSLAANQNLNFEAQMKSLFDLQLKLQGLKASGT